MSAKKWQHLAKREATDKSGACLTESWRTVRRMAMNGFANRGDEDNRRPKLVFFWNNADVMKWLKRHGDEYYGLYGHLFLEHDITGRSLVRMTDLTLQTMGINDCQHRNHILRLILKLKLKCDTLDLKDFQHKNI